jgi:hypothetical protein
MPLPFTYSPAAGTISIILSVQDMPSGFPFICRKVDFGPDSAGPPDLFGRYSDSVSGVNVSVKSGQGFMCPVPAVRQSQSVNVTGFDLFISANHVNWAHAGRILLQQRPMTTRVRPSSGPLSSALQITVMGFRFLSTSSLACAFSVSNVSVVHYSAAVFVNSTMVLCNSPQLDKIDISPFPDVIAGYIREGLIRFQVHVSLNGREIGDVVVDATSQSRFYGFDPPDVLFVTPRDAAIKDTGSSSVIQPYNLSVFGTTLGFNTLSPPSQFWARLTFPPFCADTDSAAFKTCWQRNTVVFPGGFNATRALIRVSDAPVLSGSAKVARIGLEFSVDNGATISRAPQIINLYYTTSSSSVIQAGGGSAPSCSNAVMDCGAGICSAASAPLSDVCLCFHVQVSMCGPKRISSATEECPFVLT